MDNSIPDMAFSLLTGALMSFFVVLVIGYGLLCLLDHIFKQAPFEDDIHMPALDEAEVLEEAERILQVHKKRIEEEP